MSTKIDQKAYLQKYLSGPSKDKKKKKKVKKVIKGKGFKIIDDDLDISKLRALETDELDIYGEGEDAPQVAGIIDDRPEELKKLEQFQTSTKWRVINQDDGFNSNIQIEEITQSVKEAEKENEVIFGKMYSDSEDEREREPKNQKDDSDASPPRKNSSRKQINDSDASPPRKNSSRKQHNDSDASPPRKNSSRKQHNDSDASPPRKNSSRKQHNDSDASPPRQNSSRKQHNDSDASPPRKNSSRKQHNDSDASLPRKNSSRKQHNDSDASPPRKNSSRKQHNDSDASPPRKNSSRKQNNDSDASPPRKSRKQNNDCVATLPRKATQKELSRKYDSDVSPPRKREKSPRKENHDSRKRDRAKRPSRWGDFEFEKNEIEMISKEYEKRSKNDQSISPKRNDLDVPRKRDKDRNTASERDRNMKDRDRSQRNQDSGSDLSPPRREKTRNRERDTQKRGNSDSDLSPPRKNTGRDRSKRGSESPPPTNKRMAKTLEGKLAGLQDAKQLRKENESFRRREDEVFNKMGDEVSGRNAKAVSRKGKRETSEDRNKKSEKAERQKEIDDKYKKWSKGLKQIEDQQERMQDYMHEASKPLARHKGDKDLEDRLKDVERAGDPMMQYIKEKKREAGELPPERPSYKGNFPPNRFNIRPGYRWDGVDRSNGYEKKYFDQQSKRKAQEEEAYKWSTEDL